MAQFSAKSTRVLKYVGSSVASQPCITGGDDNQFRFNVLIWCWWDGTLEDILKSTVML